MVDLLEGIGMRVLVWTRDPDPARLEGSDAEFADLETIFCSADAISLHAALTAQSRGMITGKLLQSCRPGAVFVNTARAELVEDGALERVVAAGRVRGGVDVLATEPPTRSELSHLPPELLVTPHTAYNTREAAVALVLGAIRNVTAHLAREPLAGEARPRLRRTNLGQ
jgi:phosphoglycerate dehydrogenase-like enzyme